MLPISSNSVKPTQLSTPVQIWPVLGNFCTMLISFSIGMLRKCKRSLQISWTDVNSVSNISPTNHFFQKVYFFQNIFCDLVQQRYGNKHLYIFDKTNIKKLPFLTFDSSKVLKKNFETGLNFCYSNIEDFKF